MCIKIGSCCQWVGEYQCDEMSCIFFSAREYYLTPHKIKINKRYFSPLWGTALSLMWYSNIVCTSYISPLFSFPLSSYLTEHFFPSPCFCSCLPSSPSVLAPPPLPLFSPFTACYLHHAVDCFCPLGVSTCLILHSAMQLCVNQSPHLCQHLLFWRWLPSPLFFFLSFLMFSSPVLPSFLPYRAPASCHNYQLRQHISPLLSPHTCTHTRVNQ